jgi:hypothetical protein
MSVVQVSSNVHGQLDAQIEQLTQCKPLPEQEVFFFSYSISSSSSSSSSFSSPWMLVFGYSSFRLTLGGFYRNNVVFLDYRNHHYSRIGVFDSTIF